MKNLMSAAPITPLAIRHIPCEHCGSARTVRTAYQGGRVTCVDHKACDRRTEGKRASAKP